MSETKPTYPADFRTEVHTTRDLPRPLPEERITDSDSQADNTLRAKFAAKAVFHYARRTGVLGEEPGLAISDMLGDLMHLCDALGLDFQDLIDRGAYHYEPELRGEF